jgi:hypothetical protein
MPFDGIGFVFDDRLNKIDRVIDMLATPDKWCQRVLRSADGRYCLRGAINAAEGVALLPVVLRAINEVTGKRHFRIEAFNDHPDTDHVLMLRVLSRARDNLLGATACSRAPAPTGWHERLRVWVNGLGWRGPPPRLADAPKGPEPDGSRAPARLAIPSLPYIVAYRTEAPKGDAGDPRAGAPRASECMAMP